MHLINYFFNSCALAIFNQIISTFPCNDISSLLFSHDICLDVRVANDNDQTIHSIPDGQIQVPHFFLIQEAVSLGCTLQLGRKGNCKFHFMPT